MFCFPFYAQRWAFMNPVYLHTTCKHTETHTFPGGDESRQELAEVCSRVRVLLAQRKSVEMGGRAPVLDMRLFHIVGVSLEDSCRQKKSHTQKQVTLKPSVISVFIVYCGSSREMLYLQRERRQSAGPLQRAGRRRGVHNSSRTGLPEQRTHTSLRSSKRHREDRQVGKV